MYVMWCMYRMRRKVWERRERKKNEMEISGWFLVKAFQLIQINGFSFFHLIHIICDLSYLKRPCSCMHSVYLQVESKSFHSISRLLFIPTNSLLARRKPSLRLSFLFKWSIDFIKYLLDKPGWVCCCCTRTRTGRGGWIGSTYSMGNRYILKCCVNIYLELDLMKWRMDLARPTTGGRRPEHYKSGRWLQVKRKQSTS